MSTVVVAPGPLLPATLLDRPNRYLAHVLLDGVRTAAHVPNPGRMTEFITAGRPVQLVAVAGEQRRTAYDLVALEYLGRWVCIDNRLGAKLVRAALVAHALPALEPYDQVQAEVTSGHSRLDYRLSGAAGVTWVELKSCTLVEDGIGRFPDAPSVRAARHVAELAARVAAGERAVALFLVQRPDAVVMTANDATDPAFGQALRAAVAAGVATMAYTASWSGGLVLGGPVPVDLAPRQE